jgi:EmrB/QacA subfamily drug resistance transporter
MLSTFPAKEPLAAPTRSFRESLLAMLGCCFVWMLVALDETVVGNALPTIMAELDGFELYAWVATSYLLASIITVPIVGRLGDYFGRRYFLIASIVVFTLASLLCGLAGSMLLLVLARALQGIGGGMVLGTVFACVSDLFPDVRSRIRWRLLLSIGFVTSNAVGPSLGGLLTQFYGWRTIFFVNLPVGVLGLWFVWRHMPHIRQMVHTTPIKLDWLGAILIAVFLGSLQLLVEFLPRTDLGSTVIWLLLTSTAAFAALVLWEKRFSHPIVPLAMFRNPALSALFLFSVMSGFLTFALLIYVPLLLQGGFGLSPGEAGVLITPFLVGIAVTNIVNGYLLTRIDKPRRVLLVGIFFSLIANVGIATAHAATPHWLIALYLVAGGIGQGFVNPTSTLFVQEIADRTDQGIATAMVQSLRMVGAMLGTALIGVFVYHLYVSEVQSILDSSRMMQWSSEFNDPQFLINRNQQLAFLTKARSLGQNGDLLIGMARECLVSALHAAQLLSIVVALIALVQVRRIPNLHLKPVTPPSR